MRKVWNEIVWFFKILFCIFIVFVVCWMFYVIIVVLDVQNNLFIEIYFFVIFFVYFYFSVNCIIYIFGNKRFRKGFMCFVGCVFFIKLLFIFNLDIIVKRIGSIFFISFFVISEFYFFYFNKKYFINIFFFVCIIFSFFNVKF